MPAPTLADEAKKLLDQTRREHAEAQAAFDERKLAAQTRAATDEDFRAKILDTTSDEFGELDTALRPVSELKQKAEDLERAWQMHAGHDTVTAASVSAVSAYLAGDVQAAAATASEMGVSMGLIERAASAVVESSDYQALVEGGALKADGALKGRHALHADALMDRREFRALVTGASGTSGGTFVVNDRQGGTISLPVRPLTILDLITVGQTNSDTVEFVRQTSRATNAAIVAEAAATNGVGVAGGVKPESAIAWELVQTAVKTIAHWIPATRRAVADAGQLQTMIEQSLEYGLLELLENQIIGGDGTGENFTGITETGGIATYARVAGESRLDAVHRGITLVRVQNLEPTGIGMHPTGWQDVRLEKDLNGAYMLGPANDAAPQRLFGIDVHTSTAYGTDQALVGNYRLGASLWIREAPVVYVADQHADFFVRNLLVLLAEMRAAFGVVQPKAFANVDVTTVP